MVTFDFTEKNSKNGHKISPKILIPFRRKNGWNDYDNDLAGGIPPPKKNIAIGQHEVLVHSTIGTF